VLSFSPEMISIGPRSGFLLSALASVKGLKFAVAAWNNGVAMSVNGTVLDGFEAVRDAFGQAQADEGGASTRSRAADVRPADR
jgi:hypothetical protein